MPLLASAQHGSGGLGAMGAAFDELIKNAFYFIAFIILLFLDLGAIPEKITGPSFGIILSLLLLFSILLIGITGAVDILLLLFAVGSIAYLSWIICQ